jgi:hypothetical protein
MKEMKRKFKNISLILVIVVLIIVLLSINGILNFRRIESLLKDEDLYFSNSILIDKKAIVHNFNEQIPNRKYVFIDLGANNGRYKLSRILFKITLNQSN